MPPVVEVLVPAEGPLGVGEGGVPGPLVLDSLIHGRYGNGLREQLGVCIGFAGSWIQGHPGVEVETAEFDTVVPKVFGIKM